MGVMEDAVEGEGRGACGCCKSNEAHSEQRNGFDLERWNCGECCPFLAVVHNVEGLCGRHPKEENQCAEKSVRNLSTAPQETQGKGMGEEAKAVAHRNQ